MLLADKFVSVDIDGSTQSKPEFLASIKAPVLPCARTGGDGTELGQRSTVTRQL